MKIMVCGKGGCGKSTIATLLAKSLHTLGYQVLLVDGDESNLGVSRLIGTSEPASLLDSMGGKKKLGQKMMDSFTKDVPLKLFEEKWQIRDIPENCLSQAGGVRFMAIGKIHHFGEGCACPMGALAKNFFINLETGPDDMVVIDSEAGIEHFGRGVEAGCDLILGIVDPTYESFLLSRKIEDLSVNAGKDFYFVLNKTSDKVARTMGDRINRDKIIASIPMNETLFMDSLEGRPVSANLAEIDQVAGFIQKAKSKTESTPV